MNYRLNKNTFLLPKWSFVIQMQVQSWLLIVVKSKTHDFFKNSVSNSHQAKAYLAFIGKEIKYFFLSELVGIHDRNLA